MTTFSYTSGNPSNLTAGASASMADIQGPLVDLRDFLNGGLDTANLAASAGIKESQIAAGSTGLVKGLFSAYRSTNVTVASGAIVPFNTEEIDVSGWFDITTNIGRFTPQTPGWYDFTWAARSAVAQVVDVAWFTTLRKNASATEIKVGSIAYQRGTSVVGSVGSAKMLANGSTDYFEVILNHSAAGPTDVFGNQGYTYFQGSLIGRV